MRAIFTSAVIIRVRIWHWLIVTWNKHVMAVEKDARTCFFYQWRHRLQNRNPLRPGSLVRIHLQEKDACSRYLYQCCWIRQLIEPFSSSINLPYIPILIPFPIFPSAWTLSTPYDKIPSQLSNLCRKLRAYSHNMGWERIRRKCGIVFAREDMTLDQPYDERVS